MAVMPLPRPGDDSGACPPHLDQGPLPPGRGLTWRQSLGSYLLLGVALPKAVVSLSQPWREGTKGGPWQG
jgi:hypothetical protein